MDLYPTGPPIFTIHTPRIRHIHRQNRNPLCWQESLGKEKKNAEARTPSLFFSYFPVMAAKGKGQEGPGVSPQVCLHLRGSQSSAPGQLSSQLYGFTSSVPTSAPLDHSPWEHCGVWALSAEVLKSMSSNHLHDLKTEIVYPILYFSQSICSHLF